MSEAGHAERLEAALDGKYRIERKLGEGGMASVYLAEDLKHERKVALKILRPELAAVIGAERFLSEIKTTANLQHPHILPLFDSGEAGGYLYYVMPYIEGETLRDRLDREKQLGVQESLRITKDVADALDYAHRHGVIHRDIKPGNILLHDGRPVVADFGIALAVSAAGGGRMTETGLSLGTPHYMSPEQASADRDLSARSDVYSLGCVLYEMLAGQPPHTGPSAQSILVHMLTKDVTPLTELRHTVPGHVAAAVAKSIEKLPADRFESAKAFRDSLEDAGFTYEARVAGTRSTSAAQAVATAEPKPWLRDARFLSVAAVGALMTSLAAWLWVSRPSVPASGVPTRGEITGLELAGGGWRLAISPDGRSLAAVHRDDAADARAIYLRSAGSSDWQRLANTEQANNPVFSPDGQWVAFSLPPRGVWKVPVTGGAALPVATTGGSPQWAPSDVIVYDDQGAIYGVPGSGGEPELLFQSDTIVAARPQLLPGGRTVIFGTATADQDPLTSRILLLELESGEVRELVASGNQPRYVPTGHIVFGHGGGALMAVRFDLGTLETTGAPVTLIPDLAVAGGGQSHFSVSETGTLVYLSGDAREGGGPRQLVWIDRDGREEPIPAEPKFYLYPRLSPDGTRLALDARREGVIEIWDFVGQTMRPLNLGDGRQAYPVWTPDGGRIAFHDGEGNIAWKASNNTGSIDRLAHVADDPAGNPAAHPYFFTPDGSVVVVRDRVSYRPFNDDLVMVTVADGEVVPLLTEDYIERNAALSPNGRWMAYESDESGRFEVYVRPFPDVQQNWFPISNGGGEKPLWSRDGRELFYVDPAGRLVSVPVDTGGTDGPFAFGEREVVIEDWAAYEPGADGRGYDISPDGQRFITSIRVSSTPDANTAVYIVTNWFTELRERMGED